MQKLLIVIFEIFMLQSCIVNVFSPIGLFEELFTLAIIFLLCLAIIRNYRYRYIKKKILTNSERWTCLYLFLFILSGILSTVLYKNPNNIIGIAKDSMAAFKASITYIGVLIVFDSVDKDALLKEIAKRVRLYINVLFIFCIINLFVDVGVGHDIRYGLRSYKFLYTHPTYMAFSGVIMLCLLVVDGEKKNRRYIIQTSIILVCTFRSKAMAFVIAYIAFTIYLQFREEIDVKYMIVGIIGAIFIFRAKIMDYWQYGLIAARPALTITGVKILMDYFPFGTGLCTFACSLSGEYYSSVYRDYNINFVSGLTMEDYSFMADSFWPYICGEFGFIGLVFFILVIATIYRSLQQRYKFYPEKKKAVALLFFYIIFASTAEAIFIDVTGQFALIVAAIYFGNNKGEMKKTTASGTGMIKK